MSLVGTGTRPIDDDMIPYLCTIYILDEESCHRPSETFPNIVQKNMCQNNGVRWIFQSYSTVVQEPTVSRHYGGPIIGPPSIIRAKVALEGFNLRRFSCF